LHGELGVECGFVVDATAPYMSTPRSAAVPNRRTTTSTTFAQTLTRILYYTRLKRLKQSCLMQDEPEAEPCFSYKMSLKGGIRILGLIIGMEEGETLSLDPLEFSE
jgi:hypothetical protein